MYGEDINLAEKMTTDKAYAIAEQVQKDDLEWNYDVYRLADDFCVIAVSDEEDIFLGYF